SIWSRSKATSSTMATSSPIRRQLARSTCWPRVRGAERGLCTFGCRAKRHADTRQYGDPARALRPDSDGRERSYGHAPAELSADRRTHERDDLCRENYLSGGPNFLAGQNPFY